MHVHTHIHTQGTALPLAPLFGDAPPLLLPLEMPDGSLENCLGDSDPSDKKLLLLPAPYSPRPILPGASRSVRLCMYVCVCVSCTVYVRVRVRL
jgi:hypothetical protein